MPRLLVHVEGETEESFVNEVLADHLYQFGYEKVSARLVGNSRMRENRGGIRAWPAVKKDVLNHLRGDTGCIATTMVDYYGLPQSGGKAWPGRHEAAASTYDQKALIVEDSLLKDVCGELGETGPQCRFIPYVVMHEFEGMLFSDCDIFGEAIGHPELVPKFQEIRSNFSSPEEINDSPDTAPSKRVEALVPAYQKPLFGTLAVLGIGLETIRRECPHFRQWLEKLESRGH